MLNKISNKRYIAVISLLRTLIAVFFSLFFSIYILKIVNNDINKIIILKAY